MANSDFKLVLDDSRNKNAKSVSFYMPTNQAYIDNLPKIAVPEGGKRNGKPFKWLGVIELDRLMLDESYQIEARQNRNAGLVKNWDERKCQPIQVNLRDGQYLSVINGVHRIRAAFEKGWEVIPAEIFIGLSYGEEVVMYIDQDTATAHVYPKEKFIALVQANDPECCRIYNILRSHGFGVYIDDKMPKLHNAVEGFRRMLEEANSMKIDELKYGFLDWMFTRYERNTWGIIPGATSKENISSFAKAYKYAICTDTLPLVTERLDSVMWEFGPDHIRNFALIFCNDIGKTDEMHRKTCFIRIADGTYTVENFRNAKREGKFDHIQPITH